MSSSSRLLSLDLFRGATMFLLVAETTELYHYGIAYTAEGSVGHWLAMQFHHQPFVQDHNFGAWMDTVLMGKINDDGWVAINCLPTAAHTI